LQGHEEPEGDAAEEKEHVLLQRIGALLAGTKYAYRSQVRDFFPDASRRTNLSPRYNRDRDGR